MVRIAHLSDTHIDGSRDHTHRLERVVAEVIALGDIDLVLVTGDIADHGSPAEYDQFFGVCADLPLAVVPGNHDARAALTTHVRADADGFLNTVVDLDGLTVIGLDSLIPGEVAGELSESTIAFARRALDAASGLAVIALHHPPVPIGERFMDENGLRNPEALADLVGNDEKVVGVLTGHVHAALATTFAGRPLLGAPGVSTTLRPGRTPDPFDDTATPGLAIHTIRSDGTISTVFDFLSPEPQSEPA
ncbi:metallophosphoesterase [Rathayibacter sp. CAU 1779]